MRARVESGLTLKRLIGFSLLLLGARFKLLSGRGESRFSTRRALAVDGSELALAVGKGRGAVKGAKKVGSRPGF